MGLVPFDSIHRMIWMFPRNIRRISPWKIAQIITILQDATNGSSWAGRQDIQNIFCKALEAADLKRPGEQYNPNSGGPRTYFAQLKCLGLLFQRPDKTVFYTQAGEDLTSGCPPLPILQDLLMKHQYPSCYSHLPMVKIHPEIKIKPFLFVLKLLQHKEIQKMNMQELIIPVVYGHNNECFDLCVKKILQLRSGVEISEVIDDYKVDLFTPRTAGKSLESRIKDVRDIANTLKNWLQAACLIDCDIENGVHIIKASQAGVKKLKVEIGAANSFIPYDSEESFQRRYGCLHAEKDTRSLGYHKKNNSPEKNIILSKFFEYMGNHIIAEYPDDFVDMMYATLGISKGLTRQVIEPHVSMGLSFFESTYLQLATGGTGSALAFEKATSELFCRKLKFNVRLTGQLKRQGKGGYSDIFIYSLDENQCGIIDTKASSNYCLPASDYHAMLANYIPNYKELTGGKPLELKFCCYVAGGFGNVEHSLKELTANTGVGVSAITASELLKLSNKTHLIDYQTDLFEVFKENKILTLNDFGV
jgi:hypothetical protein